MDGWAEIDNAHQARVDAEALRDLFLDEFAETILSHGEAEFNNIKYNMEEDLLFRVEKMEEKYTSVMLGFSKPVGSKAFIDAHNKYLELLNLAAYELAGELWDGRNEL